MAYTLMYAMKCDEHGSFDIVRDERDPNPFSPCPLCKAPSSFDFDVIEKSNIEINDRYDRLIASGWTPPLAK